MVQSDPPWAPRSVIEHCCKPSVHLTDEDVLGLAALVTSIAGDGEPVVVTHGTDVMEEVSFFCDLVYDGSAPIVFTGAMRLSDADDPDGPRNLTDALIVASDDAVRDLGVLVCFAGRIHAARDVRKVDSVEIDAFASPHLGPVGEVAGGLVTLMTAPPRYSALPLPSELATVEVAFVGVGSDGNALRVLAAHVDGLVVSRAWSRPCAAACSQRDSRDRREAACRGLSATTAWPHPHRYICVPGQRARPARVRRDVCGRSGRRQSSHASGTLRSEQDAA